MFFFAVRPRLYALSSTMLKIGLTGGIASGKSTVSEMLKGKGCTVIDADRVAHDLIRKGNPGYAPVVEAFGPQMLDSAGEIDRKKLGAVVFEDPLLLETLNRILHPEVIRQIVTAWDTIHAEQPRAKLLVDASLMIESGFYKCFQYLVVVTCALQQQIDRLMARQGLSEQQARQRISIQIPLEEKVRLANYVIDNSGSLDSTKAQVDNLFDELNSSLWTM
jgi:dephospho-CoA kinase